MNELLFELDDQPKGTPEPPPEPCPTCGRGGQLVKEFPAILTLADGSASVRCVGCEEEVDWSGDRIAYQASQGIPVTVTFEPEHEGLGGWHGDVRCDCGWTWEITLRREAESSSAERPEPTTTP